MGGEKSFDRELVPIELGSVSTTPRLVSNHPSFISFKDVAIPMTLLVLPIRSDGTLVFAAEHSCV